MIAVIIVLVLTSQFPYLDIFNPQITIPLDVLSSKKNESKLQTIEEYTMYYYAPSK